MIGQGHPILICYQNVLKDWVKPKFYNKNMVTKWLNQVKKKMTQNIFLHIKYPQKASA